MASRKEQKEQAKAERLAQQQAEDAKARRDRRLKTIFAIVALAVIVVIVAVVISNSSDKGGDASNIAGVSEVNASIGDIPQKGEVLGDPKAKVTITEFGDLQCPACKAFADTELSTLIDDTVKPGDAKMVFKNFTIIGPQSKLAAKAALAASLQNRYWQYIELFYRNQGIENSGYVTDAFMESVAKAAGVKDIAKWNADRKKPSWDENLAQVDQEAARLGFDSTPSFQVEGPNGKTAVPTDNSAGSIEDAVAKVQ